MKKNKANCCVENTNSAALCLIFMEPKNSIRVRVSSAVLPIGRLLMVAGGTGVPFGTVNEKKLYFYTIYKNAWCVVEPKGELPMPCYGQVSSNHFPSSFLLHLMVAVTAEGL